LFEFGSKVKFSVQVVNKSQVYCSSLAQKSSLLFKFSTKVKFIVQVYHKSQVYCSNLAQNQVFHAILSQKSVNSHYPTSNLLTFSTFLIFHQTRNPSSQLIRTFPATTTSPSPHSLSPSTTTHDVLESKMTRFRIEFRELRAFESLQQRNSKT
jgi:hypothetical protein